MRNHPLAIVWACQLSVEEYEAAGRDVEVPRPDCPACAEPMIFWSGYPRTVRDGGDRRIWVRRSKCVTCRISHCLLPAFCLLRRLYSAEVVGPALARVVAGALTREVAEAIASPYTTLRDWRRRHRARAPVLAAGFAALAVELGAVVPSSPASAEADLRNRLERDHETPSGEKRSVDIHEGVRRPEQVGAEHVGVDDDRRRAGPHALSGDRL